MAEKEKQHQDGTKTKDVKENLGQYSHSGNKCSKPAEHKSSTPDDKKKGK